MKTITARLDDETEVALANLVAARGQDQSKVIRNLVFDAERKRVLDQARQDAEALRDDPSYRAEVRAVADDLEALRAW